MGIECPVFLKIFLIVAAGADAAVLQRDLSQRCGRVFRPRPVEGSVGIPQGNRPARPSRRRAGADEGAGSAVQQEAVQPAFPQPVRDAPGSQPLGDPAEVKRQGWVVDRHRRILPVYFQPGHPDRIHRGVGEGGGDRFPFGRLSRFPRRMP